MLNIHEVTFVALDTETTGLVPGIDELVEIAAIQFRTSPAVQYKEFHRLLKPGRPISQEAQQVHGLTPKILRTGYQAVDAVGEFEEFLGRANSVLVGHNIGFDISFINCTMRRAGQLPLRNVAIDTVALARSRLPGRSCYRLQAIAQHVGACAGRPHRALDDARMVLHLLTHLLAVPPRILLLEELVDLAGWPR